MNHFYSLLWSLFFFSPIFSQDILIIIHGTFAHKELWYKPQGDFYKALQISFKKSKPIPFTWSGKLGEPARLQGAQELAHFIIRSFFPEDRLFLIAHSHGVDVALDAAHYLANTHYKIYRLYSLGAPIRHAKNRPDMNVIEKVHNLFSYGDRVQPVIQFFRRTFPAHPRITNTQVRIHAKCPDHSAMHHPLIAHALPLLDTILLENKDCMVNLHEEYFPLVKEDSNREWDLYIDRKFTLSIIENNPADRTITSLS